MFETGNQLKAYIQREIKNQGFNSNYGYNYYFTRAFLEKIYNCTQMKLILKGGYSQFIRLGKITRPITDIDIVTFEKIEHAKDTIDEIIYGSKRIKFKVVNYFTTTNATINYKILCDFDGKTGRISLDLKREKGLDFSQAQMPNLFTNDKSFQTLSISIEEHLASKLYVILLHLKLNNVLAKEYRRFKDFFDVHTILGSAIIDEKKVMEILQIKIKQDEFLKDYELNKPLFKSDFIEQNKVKWEIDKNNYQFLNNTSFEEAVTVTNNFISRKK